MGYISLSQEADVWSRIIESEEGIIQNNYNMIALNHTHPKTLIFTAILFLEHNTQNTKFKLKIAFQHNTAFPMKLTVTK